MRSARCNEFPRQQAHGRSSPAPLCMGRGQRDEIPVAGRKRDLVYGTSIAGVCYEHCHQKHDFITVLPCETKHERINPHPFCYHYFCENAPEALAGPAQKHASLLCGDMHPGCCGGSPAATQAGMTSRPPPLNWQQLTGMLF